MNTMCERAKLTNEDVSNCIVLYLFSVIFLLNTAFGCSAASESLLMRLCLSPRTSAKHVALMVTGRASYEPLGASNSSAA